MTDRWLRAVFDEDAELYDRSRPGYPPRLFTDLAELATTGPGSRVLEIGPGTGQATADLATRGAHVTCVELGAELAAVLRRKFAGSVDVIVADFDQWPLPPAPFDTVAAFTAWHWLDPKTRTAKVADALRPGGSLATVATTHVQGGTEEFFAKAHECYRRWDPRTTEADAQLTAAADVAATVDEVDASDLFAPAARRRYVRTIRYSTDAYLDVLGTYSNTRALDTDRRRRLMECIGRLIDDEYGGQVAKCYLHELRTTRRVAEA